MRKTTTLLLAFILSFGCLSACGSQKMDISDVDIPEFAETDGVKFLAYSGPTVENWSGSSGNVSTFTDEHFQKFVDAGFTGLLAVHEGAPTYSSRYDPFEEIRRRNKDAEEDAVAALALCEKYDLKYYVRDWPFYDFFSYSDASKYDAAALIDTREEYEQALRETFTEDNPYIYSSAYAGNFGRDEPGVDQFEMLKWQIEIYNEIMAERGIENAEFFLNLLPSYGSDVAYGGERGEPTSYANYVDKYFEELAPLLGYVSYDYYPFLRDAKKGSLLRSTYLSNLELMARKCKESGCELRTFVQTGADFTGLRDITSIADFRLQVYSNLAFGSKVMTYYEYGTFNSQDEGEFGLINLQDGTYNYTYDLAKKVNNEVHAFEDAYLHYDYEGVMCFSALPAGQINANFRSIAQKMTSHPRIGKVTMTEDAIISAFKDNEGNDAFMLLNYNDPWFNLDNTVTVQFKDAKGLLMYRFGEEYVVPLNKDGTYTFVLYPGEGRFIIPLK